LAYVTDLYYISFKDRGGSPEELCNCAFNITINGVDPNFEYMRIYSVIRNTLDGPAVIKIL